MKNLFKTLHPSPTSLEESSIKELSILNYMDITSVKSSRLCSISKNSSPEPYVVEVVTKITASKINYKAVSFKTLSDASNFQKELV